MRDLLNGIAIRMAFKLGYIQNFYREPAFRAIETRYGIKRPEILTLMFLRYQDGVTVAEICEFSGHLKANIQRAVHDLMKKQMIRRMADASDRRRQLLFLLPRGLEIVDAFMPSLVEREMAMLAPLSSRERAQFERLLDKLCDHVPAWGNIADL
jgi:MarR family transcriptional regulator, temperature-dependent positive regulator of motility